MSALWLPIALLSYAIQAINGVLDRIIVHKEVTKPIVISFWVAVFSVLTLGIVIVGWLPVPFAEEFKFQTPSLEILLLSIASGALTQVALLYMFKALVHAGATVVLSFIGATTPIFTLIFAYYWLSERIDVSSIAALAVLVAGTALLLAAGITRKNLRKKSAKKHGSFWSNWIVLSVIASVLFALQSVVAKDVFDRYHFISAFALTAVGALMYLIIVFIFSKDARAAVLPAKPKKAAAAKTKSKSKKGAAQPKSQVWLIVGNSALGGFGAILLNYAINLGSPTLVNALRGVQYAIIFLIALALSKRYAHLLDEDLSRRAVIIKLSAVALLTVGVAILAINA